MTKHQQQVREFHKKFGLVVNTVPTLVYRATAILRCQLIQEELDELMHAWITRDIVEVADALADLQYVLDGAAVSFGIDLEPLSEEVHRSNMTKVWPDGQVHKDQSGKVLKPKSYSPADIASLLKKQYTEKLYND